MSNDFLANLHQEGEPAFEDESEKLEKDTQAESPPEDKSDDEQTESSTEEKKETEDSDSLKEDAKEEPVSTEDVPFHEHPRWQAREQEFQELKKRNEELLEFQQRAEPLLSRKEEEKPVSAPQWFTNLFGSDDNAWSQYRESSKEEREQIKKEVLTELKPFIETAEKSKKQKELDDWATGEWKSLSEDPEVQKDLKTKGLTLEKIQSDISQVMSKYLPTDEKTGNVSIKKSYELWKDTYKPSVKSSPGVQEKKNIAGRTISKSSEKDNEKKDYRTSEDFRGKTFTDLAED